ncbi:ankyrin repeat protein, partial [Opisthorchis viverrini]
MLTFLIWRPESQIFGFGLPDIVDLLLNRGAKVDLAGSDGRSALRAAAWAGHEEIVQRLLDAGANVDIQDAEGRSPLIAAAYMGHVGVVELIAQA